MRTWRIWGLAVLFACKAEIGGVTEVPGDGDLADAFETVTADAAVPLGPWSTPTLVPGANSALAEDDGTLSGSELELIFAKEDPTDAGRKHLFVVTRETPASTTWTAPVRLAINVNGTTDQTPRLSEDALTLYFGSNRLGTAGDLDIWQSTRTAVGATWSTPVLVDGVNSVATEKWCTTCDGGRFLVVSARAPSTSEDIYEGTLGGGAPVLAAALSSASGDTGPFLTTDCLTVYFASSRNGPNRIYRSTRTSVTAPWSAPVLFEDFLASIGGGQEDPWLAADNRTFVFSSNASGSKDVYISTR
ncbi:MAG: PD40 domain-containing protein [Deltaproteobacteria bacterium]|nr:PD40 domain-containing protein [Deltaproteobacteria bacterium]